MLEKGVLVLPFAGITLTRFYGYDLSLAASCQTPRESAMKFKNSKKVFTLPVTFARRGP